jgi:SAM-dependent methyltransferase
MRSDLVPFLRCPSCSVNSQLTLQGPSVGEVTRSGTLRCESCGKSSEIVDGIWNAMGTHHPPRTLAQLSNVVPPTPQLYERLWRVRSLSLLSGRSFPNSEELSELNSWFKPLPAGSRIVDVGCSEGLYARSLAASGHTVFALDHSKLFLERVIERTKGSGLAIVCVRAIAQHMPLADASAAAVMIGGSLNEIGDQVQATAEMGRVCAPGGLLFDMSLTTAQTLAGRILQTVLRTSGVEFPSKDKTRALFEQAGFSVDRMRADGVVLRLEGTRRAQRPQSVTSA